MTLTDLASPPPAPAAPPAPVRGSRRRPPTWWVHVPFALVVLIGLVPRTVAVLGYQPLLMFYGDSYGYLLAAQTAVPPTTRPYGYPVLLRLFSWTDQFWLIAVVQHVAIVVLAIVLYRWLLRRGAPVWLATIVPTPLLLDGYQVLTEHAALTETLFICLLVTCTLLVVRAKVSPAAAAVAGGLLAATALTRTIAVPLVALFVAYLCIKRVGWKPVVAFIAAFSIPLLTYAAWYQSNWGEFALQQDGKFLYARVAQFADCTQIQVPDGGDVLCEDTIPATRPSPNFYAWSKDSPLNSAPLTTAQRQALAREFASAVISGQPVDYAKTVLGDTVQYFGPGRSYTPQDTPPSWWNFPTQPAAPGQQLALSGSGFNNDSVDVVLNADAADFLRGWQRTLSTQGPILLLGLLLGLAGAIWGRSQPGGVRRLDGLLIAGVGTSLLFLASATSVFDYRYGIPSAPFLYLSGGVGALALLQRRGASRRVPSVQRRRPASRPGVRNAVVTAVILGVVAAIAFAPISQHPIYARYVAAGAERGNLGYPTSSEQDAAGLPGWRERSFEGGRIYRSPNGAMFVIGAESAAAYDDLGGAEVLGAPVSNTKTFVQSQGDAVTWYTGGAVSVSKIRGTHTIVPPLLDAWCSPRTPCRLGTPTEGVQVGDDGTLLQTFQRGVLFKAPGEPVQRLIRVAGGAGVARDEVKDDNQRNAVG